METIIVVFVGVVGILTIFGALWTLTHDSYEDSLQEDMKERGDEMGGVDDKTL